MNFDSELKAGTFTSKLNIGKHSLWLIADAGFIGICENSIFPCPIKIEFVAFYNPEILQRIY